MGPVRVEDLIHLIRDEIRSEKPYLIGGSPDAHCKMNQNECPFDLPADLKNELFERFKSVEFNRYPREQPFELVAALESRLGRPEGSVLVGNGSNDLTQTLGLCFVSDGTRVVLPRPMFALYESVVRMHSGQVVGIPPKANFEFDIEAVIEASRASANLVVVSTPNNPTGLSVPFESLEMLCREASGFVVIDEAYHEFCPYPSTLSLLDQYPNLIVMRTLSKAFGLAGIRIGYLVAHPSVTAEILKARLPFMIDRFSEATAIELVNRPELIRERVQAMKNSIESLTERLTEIRGLDVVPSSTNFVIFKAEIDAATLAAELAHTGVIIRSVSGYPELRGFVRVTAGTVAENNEFIEALKNVLKETSRR